MPRSVKILKVCKVHKVRCTVEPPSRATDSFGTHFGIELETRRTEEERAGKNRKDPEMQKCIVQICETVANIATVVECRPGLVRADKSVVAIKVVPLRPMPR